MKKVLLFLSIIIAAYANAQTYQIGDLIEFPDKTFGVVFYLNEQTGDGLAVSMDEIETQWEAADDEEDCHNIYKLIDKGSYGEFCVPGAGEEQTRLIIEQLGMQYAPAAGWCVMHGEGWYLPSASELYHMLFVVNDCGGDSGPLSSMIKSHGGQTIEHKCYWSSCEEDTEHAFNIYTIPKRRKFSEEKNSEQGVRAVRHFKL